jgi:hypothetical protein
LIFGSARFHRKRDKDLIDELTRPFIETHGRPTRIIRVFIEVKDSLPMPNEFTCDLAKAPSFN